MAISHNLATINDNLSGFDPVAGEVDGTTIGKDYVMWQIFDAMRTFDTRIKLITASSPTPAFLQGVVGSLVSAPAKNTSTTTNTIRFYMSDDPGLSQATPNAIVYELAKFTSATSGYIIFFPRVKHLVSGGTLFVPTTSSWVSELWTANNNTDQACMWMANGGTTTTMSLIPKIIFWKTSNSFMLMSINKANGVPLGTMGFTYKGWAGYKHNVGAITEGLDINGMVGFNGRTFGVAFEGITQTSVQAFNSVNGGLSIINSSGRLPSNLFTFSGINNVMFGKIWLCSATDTTFIIQQTSALEGIFTANTIAVSVGAGTIYQYNTKYYLVGFNFNDGRDTWRILFELGT
jgi:hypothetical protein